jgi:hypothetical protein
MISIETVPTNEQLDQLSLGELLALVKSLLRIIEQQQHRVTELEAEVSNDITQLRHIELKELLRSTD